VLTRPWGRAERVSLQASGLPKDVHASNTFLRGVGSLERSSMGEGKRARPHRVGINELTTKTRA
jgi:hypothetical protein